MASSIGTYDTNGKGICIIIVNYHKEAKGGKLLKGYNKDVEEIKRTFNSENFDFDVVEKVTSKGTEGKQGTLPLENLTKPRFEEAIKCLQDIIKENKYDKFVMFVLSHGGKKGILMCPEGEKDKGEYVSVDYIIESFTHQNVPCLQGKPKCFFFQACRGSGEAYTGQVRAADGSHQMTDDTPENQELVENEPLILPEITWANILVGYATISKKRCYVEGTGSVYIQTLCQSLNQLKGFDLISVLTHVNAEISKTKVPQNPVSYVRFYCDEDDIRQKQEGESVRVEVVGRYKGNNDSNQQVPDVPLHFHDTAYAIRDRANDYEFKGDIKYLKSGKIYWDAEDGKLEGDDLARCFRKQAELKGTLQSKINKQCKENGLVEYKDNKLTVSGKPLTHRWEINKDIEVMVRAGEDLKPLKKKADEKGELFVDGVKYYDGHFRCDLAKGDRLYLRCKVRQMSVFESTLTKRLVLYTAENPFPDIGPVPGIKSTIEDTEKFIQSFETKLNDGDALIEDVRKKMNARINKSSRNKKQSAKEEPISEPHQEEGSDEQKTSQGEGSPPSTTVTTSTETEVEAHSAGPKKPRQP